MPLPLPRPPRSGGRLAGDGAAHPPARVQRPAGAAHPRLHAARGRWRRRHAAAAPQLRRAAGDAPPGQPQAQVGSGGCGGCGGQCSAGRWQRPHVPPLLTARVCAIAACLPPCGAGACASARTGAPSPACCSPWPACTAATASCSARRTAPPLPQVRAAAAVTEGWGGRVCATH